MKNILTENDISTIKSKSLYWRQVAQRENGGDILRQEIRDEVNRLGLKLLWILEECAMSVDTVTPCPECGCDELLCGYPRECSSENKNEN